MSKLVTNLNELSKDPQTQLSQIQYMGNDIVNWGNSIQGKVLIDYSEPTNQTNETTSSTSFSNLQNFSFSFTPNQPLCTVTLHLFLQGEGYIGIIINGLLIGSPIYFNNSSASILPYTKKFQLSNNKQSIALQWRSVNSGSKITKVNTPAQPGVNSIQISSENS
jgi:hypothetical protein